MTILSVFPRQSLALEKIYETIDKASLGVVWIGPLDEQKGSGSGVIIDPRGYIITNNHVVDGLIQSKSDAKKEVLIIFKNGRRLIGEIINNDLKKDLALIKADPQYSDFYEKNFIKIGDSSLIKVGQEVFAIGHPLGLDWTVTNGIISSIDRPGNLYELSFDEIFFIQTDAAINPGNSGGALLNKSGNLVGINTIIKIVSGGNIGLGFAISSNDVKNFFEKTINGKELKKQPKSWAGIKLQYIAFKDYKKQAHLQVTLNSFIIEETIKDGPAEKAGLKKGDIIVTVDGREFLKNYELAEYIHSHSPGNLIIFNVIRGSISLELKVITKEKPLEKETMPPPEPEEPKVRIGIQFDILARHIDLLERLKKSNSVIEANHFYIFEVSKDSPAEKAGIKTGDVIIGYDGQQTQGMQKFLDYLETKNADDLMSLAIIRNNETKIFVVILEKMPVE